MSRSQDEWPKNYISELSLLEHKYSPPPFIETLSNKSNNQKNQLSERKKKAK